MYVQSREIRVNINLINIARLGSLDCFHNMQARIQTVVFFQTHLIQTAASLISLFAWKCAIFPLKNPYYIVYWIELLGFWTICTLLILLVPRASTKNKNEGASLICVQILLYSDMAWYTFLARKLYLLYHSKCDSHIFYLFIDPK